MTKVNQIVQKIKPYYVGDDCVQVMVPYEKEAVILNDSGITFSQRNNSESYVNRYIEDERRHGFPYSGIPMHYSKKGIFGKLTYVNQLMDFERPYILVSNSAIIESYALKDKNEAFVLSKVMSNTPTIKNMTRGELELLFSEQNGKYVVPLDVDSYNVMLGEKYPLTEEKQIRQFLKEDIKYCVDEFRKYIKNNSSEVSSFLESHPWFLDYISQSIDNSDLSFLDTSLQLKGGRAVIIDFNNGFVKLVRSYYRGEDKYSVKLTEMPITKYSIEQLKNLTPKIEKTKEPSIPLKLNPGITKEEIKREKQKIKSFRK